MSGLRRITRNRTAKSNVGTSHSKGSASALARRCRSKMRGVWLRVTWSITTTCVSTAPSATSRRRTCSPGISRRFRPSGTGSWRRQENSGGIDATGPRDADNLLFADDSDKWLRSGSRKTRIRIRSCCLGPARVEECMLERFASRYLWFSPFAFIVLLPLYHGVGFWAGVTGGVLHLALVAWGMHANHAFTGRDDTAALLLGPMLLIAGGAEVWATGASGPPTAAHPNVALFNQAGLTLGFFVT